MGRADEISEKELKKIARVLEDAGVFKDQQAFGRFIQTLNKQVVK
ncbi:hypothetical protein [Virgibacillus indicus]|nr:hypothetical protein [Virgibacillus indicus]